MGQYHIVVNIDKKEYLYPHDYGDGLKQREFGESRNGTLTALTMLLATSNSRGGGDFPVYLDVNGRWGGDRIVIIGDYSEKGDCPALDTMLEAWQKENDMSDDNDCSTYRFVQGTFKRLNLCSIAPDLVSKDILTGAS